MMPSLVPQAQVIQSQCHKNTVGIPLKPLWDKYTLRCLRKG